jgi:hypothetical protein
MDFETELFPSVYITDGIFPSVIPLLFSGFLVVNQSKEQSKNQSKKKYTERRREQEYNTYSDENYP